MSDLFVRLKKELPSGILSKSILYGFGIIAMLLFGLFFFVGYDNIHDNPRFYAPLFTDTILVFGYVMLSLAVVAVMVSLAYGIKNRGTALKTPNGIHATAITVGVIILLLLTLVMTFAFGSIQPIEINGLTFTDATWLRLTDMLINSILILTAVALLLIVFGKVIGNIKK